jgi:hypothetical protein
MHGERVKKRVPTARRSRVRGPFTRVQDRFQSISDGPLHPPEPSLKGSGSLRKEGVVDLHPVPRVQSAVVATLCTSRLASPNPDRRILTRQVMLDGCWMAGLPAVLLTALWPQEMVLD